MTAGSRRPGGWIPLLLALSALVAPSRATTQEPDSAAAAPQRANCVLTWRGAGAGQPRTTSEQVAPGVYTHYVSGRMLWTCGTATMEADSAVNLEDRRQVNLIGNVVYQDTIRTLESEFLTYFELQDLVIAREDVVLVRLTDRSRLTGPYVEFLRAVSGVDELTTALGRPHMTLVPSGEEPGPPLEIDADRAVFAGEEEARAYGNVILSREDLDGEADSLRMLRAEERGNMWGNPWIEARDVRLEGDEIEFRSEDEVLTDVHAIGNGHAIGESFDVRGTRIDIDMADEEPERVWAHGEGRSEALSGDHRVYGDSLEFALFEGAIDTMYAVGEAIAVQGGPDAESAQPAMLDSLGAAADSLALPPDSTIVPPDSTLALSPDSTVLPPDSLGVVPADSAGAPGDSLAAASGAGTGADSGPRLRVDGRANWIRGDTVIAIFERKAGEGGAQVDSLAAGGTEVPGVAPEDSTATVETLAESALAGTDSLTAGAAAAADSASDPIMERLVAIGHAQAYYSAVRDSLSSAVPSRNYMIGSRIDLYFKDGQPARVVGREAIGLFLEPENVLPPGEMAADSSGIVGDSTGVRPDSLSVPPDSVSVPPDTLGAPPDTGSVGRRTAAGPGGGGAVSADRASGAAPRRGVGEWAVPARRRRG